MCKKNNSALFFTCSLIEQLGRDLKLRRSDVVAGLGKDRIELLLDRADILHCEPIVKVADDVAQEFQLNTGVFDNIADAHYLVPDVWTIGKVYARLIEDVSTEDNISDTLCAVYSSWIDAALSNYNTSFYYSSRDYIAECYRQGQVLDD